MGYYVNPTNGTKETWLSKHGKPISDGDAQFFDFVGPNLPVCLVDNGLFTAAGIAYCSEERDAFVRGMSDRPHNWYLVDKQLLEPWLGRAQHRRLPV